MRHYAHGPVTPANVMPTSRCRCCFAQVGMRFLTERGQNVNGQPNIIYVSSDNGATWFPLHEFVDVRFLLMQLSYLLT